MTFDQLLQDWRSGQGTSCVPEGWTQGRATFGGLVAAMLYEQMAAEISAANSLRSLTTSFVRPVAAGAIETRVEMLRAGRSVTQINGYLDQGDTVMLAGMASFGNGRESTVRVKGPTAPKYPAPEECLALPYIEGVVPEFTQKFDYRIARGQLPFSGSTEKILGGWVRFKDGSKSNAGISHLLALIDAWPPATLPMLKAPAPASSLTWTAEFMEPLAKHKASDWWQYQAAVEQAENGYAVIQSRLWDTHGHLAALSQQMVTLFG
ncbi:thioesterase family protein [Microbulbifer sp. OS29]|uniref:Thioesterase family protein n=1 Tax=Microbulbifer okhotskensis TaxID=2926617 RepID=A0A9X2J7N4_9GAMM|nr:thioesterase family protein [Microbulbifer okhotskensis]MCO1334666.1 thioesterase family protein [Microbulbifer okhotskensis]